MTVYLPLQRIARLNPSASAVPELIFSTILCLTFFKTRIKKIVFEETLESQNYLTKNAN